MPDSDGKCLVEGFTVGREGYGNIHYPGTTDITGTFSVLEKPLFFYRPEKKLWCKVAKKALTCHNIFFIILEQLKRFLKIF